MAYQRILAPVILHFCKGNSPSEDDQIEALAYGPGVRYRNSLHVDNTLSLGSIEKCDGVSGAVPELYAKKYPHARDAIEKHMRQYVRRTNGTVDPEVQQIVEQSTSGELLPITPAAPAAVQAEGEGVAADLDAAPALTSPLDGWAQPAAKTKAKPK